jgi:hypothetical protein
MATGMDQDKQDTKAKSSKAGARRPAAPEQAFDLWLNQKLHDMYDDVTQEPIPPELLQLIEEDRTRKKG